MFSVLFEVRPRLEEWDAYLEYAKMLKPELEQIDGFVDNIRYRSLSREGWILSLSNWRDEKALVRWRTAARHFEVQEKGRSEVLLDYHLRVGQIISDNMLPAGQELREQRLDETETGAGTAATLIDTTRSANEIAEATPEQCAEWLGFDPHAEGLMGWEVFDAVLEPGKIILAASWRDHTAADHFESNRRISAGVRSRQVRVVRDYGMFDRHEAPQYYPPLEMA